MSQRGLATTLSPVQDLARRDESEISPERRLGSKLLSLPNLLSPAQGRGCILLLYIYIHIYIYTHIYKWLCIFVSLWVSGVFLSFVSVHKKRVSSQCSVCTLSPSLFSSARQLPVRVRICPVCTMTGAAGSERVGSPAPTSSWFETPVVPPLLHARQTVSKKVISSSSAS